MLERIGIVLQECDFPRHLRVAELLSAWRGYYPSPLPLAELLDVVELREERGTLVRRLSGGQRRRLDFALALAGDPDLMFLDEPATGFGLEARRRCWAVIGNLRSLGKTILLTMHQLDEAERLSDRVAILSDGRIQMAGTPRALAREVGRAHAHLLLGARAAQARRDRPGACGSWRTRPGWSSARSGGTRSTRCSRSRFRWSCPWCSGPPSPATSSRSPTPARSHCSCRECWPSA
jgi:ABC-type multidrug transport system ATPase subunit